MKKIINPYINIKGYNCFGCAPDNPHGLRMEFHEEGEETISVWNPRHHFQGYGNILHGGIQASLMDELGSWAVFIKLSTAGITKKLMVNYIKPVYTNNGEITLRAVVKEVKDNIANIYIRLFDKNGVLRSDCSVEYFMFPEDIAKRRLHYPGKNAFFDEF